MSGKIKKITEDELVGGTSQLDVYPITSTKAVYDPNNITLHNILNNHLLAKYMYGGVLSPTDTFTIPSYKTFYIATGGVYPQIAGLEAKKGQIIMLSPNQETGALDRNVINVPYATSTDISNLDSQINEINAQLSNLATAETVENIKANLVTLTNTVNTKASKEELGQSVLEINNSIDEINSKIGSANTRLNQLENKDQEIEATIQENYEDLSGQILNVDDSISTELERIESKFDTEVGKLNTNAQNFVGIYNVSKVNKSNDGTYATYADIKAAILALNETIVFPGIVITFLNNEGIWETYQYNSNDNLDWGTDSFWEPFGSGSGSGAGNVYNVTVLNPLSENQYYTKETAIAAIPEEYKRIGLVITFINSRLQWKSYQYDYYNLEKWSDVNKWTEYNPKGTVTKISINGGGFQSPEDNGELNLNIDGLDRLANVDNSPTADSSNLVTSGGVYQAIDSIESGGSYLNLKKAEDSENIYLELYKTPDDFSGGNNPLSSVILPQMGGGGITTSTTVVLKKISGPDSQIKLGSNVEIQYSYDQQDLEGNSTGNPANITYEITNGGVVTKITDYIYAEGTKSFNATKYITSTGTTKIRIVATVDDSTNPQQASTTWTFTVIELKLQSSFNYTSEIIKDTNTTLYIPYALTGIGNKTLYTYIDGEIYDTRSIASSSASGNVTVPYSKVDSLSHGSHSIQLVAEVEAGATIIKSNSIYFDIAVRQEGNKTPIIVTRFDYSDGTIINTGEVPYAETKQFDNYELRYSVYDPNQATPTIQIKQGDLILQETKIAFIAQTFTYRYTSKGTIRHSINCGNTVYYYDVKIGATDLNIEEPERLKFHLEAIGRSNSDVNRDTWENNGITTTFKNFTWSGDGWLNNALRLRDSARAVINYKPLERPSVNPTNSFAFNIKFKVSSITDESAIIVKCIDDTGIGFTISTQEVKMIASGGETVSAKFASGEVYNIMITSYFDANESSADNEKLNDNMLYLYINGILSGAVEKSSGSGIYQTNPQYIELGSNDCILDIYSIRAYDYYLSDDQVLDLFIIDTDNSDKLIELYNFNNILNEGIIDKEYLYKDLPYMIITGDSSGTPTFLSAAITNNKKAKFDVDSILYVDKLNPKNSFYAKPCMIRLQGTSSLAYPRKNYRIYFKTMDGTKSTLYTDFSGEDYESGTIASKPVYSMSETAAPVNCFCLKADYAESSSSHNTGFANMVDSTLKQIGHLTPAQKNVNKEQYPYNVRTTIEGHPCLVFYRSNESETPKFGGKFNFNNDKSTEAVFGFCDIPGYHDAAWVTEKFGGQNPTECWEFLTNEPVLVGGVEHNYGCFKEDDFTLKSDTGKPAWLNQWEARYPDDDALNAEYENGKIPTYLKNTVSWLKSTDTKVSGLTSEQIKERNTKFKNELKDYFDVTFLCDYYILNDVIAGVDQRVKNMMWGFWYDPNYTGASPNNGVLCYPIYYDNDTILGVRNDGKLVFNWDIDENSKDVDSDNYAFAGHDSVLWENLRNNFKDELTSSYQSLRQVLTNAKLFEAFDTNQSDRFCERIFNKDSLYKYIEPATQGVVVNKEGSTEVQKYNYLTSLQGSRKSHRHWFIQNRFDLFDARYVTGDYKSTSLQWKSQGTDQYVEVTAARDYYFASNADNVINSQFIKENEIFKFNRPGTTAIGTTYYIYGVRYAKKLNIQLYSLNNLDFNGTFSVLKELILGDENQSNAALGTLKIEDKMPLLESIEIRNVSGTTFTSLDLTYCNKLQTIKCPKCTNLTSITISAGTPVSTLLLPENYGVLRLVQLPQITNEGITFENISNITGLIIDSCAKINKYSLLNSIVNSENTKLKYIRITDFNVDGNGNDLITIYNKKIKGYINNSGTIDSGNICSGLVGEYRLTQLLDSNIYNNLVNYFTNLTIIQPEYSIYEFNDGVSTTKKVSNFDNSTGYKFGNTYNVSGHVKRILEQRHAYIVKSTSKGTDASFVACQLSDSSYLKFEYDGSDSTSALATNSVMMLEPHYWYKGVNDSKNDIHYALFSSQNERPKNTGEYIKILPSTSGVTIINNKLVSMGIGYSKGTDALLSASGNTSYKYIIPKNKQWKQFRAASVTSSAGNYGIVVVDKDDNIIQRVKPKNNVHNLMSNYYLFDSFTDFDNAYAIYFSTNDSYATTFPLEYIALLTTSSYIEAIEPDWMEHKLQLVGVERATYRDNVVGADIDITKNSITTMGIGDTEEITEYVKKAQAIPGSNLADYEVFKDFINLCYVTYGDTDVLSVVGCPSYKSKYVLNNNTEPGGIANMKIILNKGMEDTFCDLSVLTSNSYYFGTARYEVDGTTYDIQCNSVLGYKGAISYSSHFFGYGADRQEYFTTLNNRKVPMYFSSNIYPANILGGKHLDILHYSADNSGSVGNYYCRFVENAKNNIVVGTRGGRNTGDKAIANARTIYILSSQNHRISHDGEGCSRSRLVFNPTSLQIVNNPTEYNNL